MNDKNKHKLKDEFKEPSKFAIFAVFLFGYLYFSNQSLPSIFAFSAFSFGLLSICYFKFKDNIKPNDFPPKSMNSFPSLKKSYYELNILEMINEKQKRKLREIELANQPVFVQEIKSKTETKKNKTELISKKTILTFKENRISKSSELFSLKEKSNIEKERTNSQPKQQKINNYEVEIVNKVHFENDKTETKMNSQNLRSSEFNTNEKTKDIKSVSDFKNKPQMLKLTEINNNEKTKNGKINLTSKWKQLKSFIYHEIIANDTTIEKNYINKKPKPHDLKTSEFLPKDENTNFQKSNNNFNNTSFR